MALSLQTSIFQSMNNPGFSSYDNQLYKASLDIGGESEATGSVKKWDKQLELCLIRSHNQST